LLSAVCFAQAAQQSPAEVPVENEPHHHLVFENEYVRVFKVEVAPHEATLVHRHKRDYVVVTIGDAEVTNAVVGKEPKKWSFKDGDVTFLEASGEKSFAHKAVNESDKPFRNYTIEVKRSALHVRVAKDDRNSLNDRGGYCILWGSESDTTWCSGKTLYVGCGVSVVESGIRMADQRDNFAIGDVIADSTLVVAVSKTRKFKPDSLFWVSKSKRVPKGLTRAVFISFTNTFPFALDIPCEDRAAVRPDTHPIR
jgi:hypothetical protein